MKELYKLPQKLREFRIQNNFSQKFVAEKLGIKYQSYQAYELGLSMPSIKSLIILADLYDVSLDYLVGRKEY